MKCEMAIMGSQGDTKVEWDSENTEEVDNARKQFDSLTKKKFRAFRVKGDGEAGELMRSFDPEAEKMILIPPMAGG